MPQQQQQQQHDVAVQQLEDALRALVAQARDVVQEIGEIKAEIRHINDPPDTHTREKTRAQQSTAGAVHATASKDQVARRGRTRSPATATRGSTRADGGRWPLFSQETIQRFERGLDSRGEVAAQHSKATHQIGRASARTNHTGAGSQDRAGARETAYARGAQGKLPHLSGPCGPFPLLALCAS